MEISGKIIAVCEPKGGVSQRTGKEWKTQDYVIETIEEKPQRCVFNVFGEDRINEYNIKIGDNVKVVFNLDAREYNGRWFNSLNAASVVKNTVKVTKPKNQKENPDDLPF